MEARNNNKVFSDHEIDQILALRKEGKQAKEIAEMLGRTTKSIYNIFYRPRQLTDKEALMVGGVKVAEVPAEMIEKKEQPVKVVEKTRDMTPREMIKKLYDIGYRIEDNQLVCYVRQSVNIKDIIANG